MPSTSQFPTSIDAFPASDMTLPPAALINDSIVALQNYLLGPVNALGVVGTATVTLAPGQNTITNTSSLTTTIAFPTAQAGTKVCCTFTQATGTAGTWAFSTTPQKAGGSFALSTTAAYVDYCEFVYNGSHWQAAIVNLHVS